MQSEIGKEYKNPAERMRFLKDNCDKVEEKFYMKPYSPEELQQHKENLANLSIEIQDIEEELKAAKEHYKEMLKPLKEDRKEMVDNIKQKAEMVKEQCYAFVDRDTRRTAYYNSDGDLVEERPSTADELQPTLFHTMPTAGNDTPAKTGTEA